MSYLHQFEESMSKRAQRLNAMEVKSLNLGSCPLFSDHGRRRGCTKCYRGINSPAIPHQCVFADRGCGAYNMHTTAECVMAKLRAKSAGTTSRFKGPPKVISGRGPVAAGTKAQPPCPYTSSGGKRRGCSRCYQGLGLDPLPHPMK